MDKKELKLMFDNLLHIGNKKNFWNPRMRDYIYGSVNGIHVINLSLTYKKIDEVKEALKNLASEGKKILFVATKIQARDSFVKLAEDSGHFYVTEKWVPGLLTNFKTIKKRIATYLKLLKDASTGGLDILTKKEKAEKMLELEKLDKAFRGLKDMKSIPDIIFVADSIYEGQAVKEANSLGLKIYAIANTNADDTILTDLIPSNTNSVKGFEYLASVLRETLINVKVVGKKVDTESGIQKMAPKKISGDNKTIKPKASMEKEIIKEDK